MVLNYIPHSSSLYDNILSYFNKIYEIVQDKLDKHAKTYLKLISGIEKRTITKNHTLKPKLAKEVVKKIEEVRNVELYK
jgi:hypothetical protein